MLTNLQRLFIGGNFIERLAKDDLRGLPALQVKFIYSEKATKFSKIFTLLLSYVVPIKSKVKISQNYVAFSEYMNSYFANKQFL